MKNAVFSITITLLFAIILSGCHTRATSPMAPNAVGFCRGGCMIKPTYTKPIGKTCKLTSDLLAKSVMFRHMLMSEKSKCPNISLCYIIDKGNIVDRVMSQAGCKWEDIGLPRVITVADMCGIQL